MTEPVPLGGRWGRIGPVLAAVAMTVVVATAMAWLPIGDEEPDDVASGAAAADEAADIEQELGAHAAMEDDPERGQAHHEPLPAYDDRYAEATPAERAAADKLLTDVRATLTAYADLDAALAAGYQAPQRQRGAIAHYINVDFTLNGEVLDRAKPSGLVYFTREGREPVLLGAFFVARPGKAAPNPAGDLVVWHSHSLDCPDFYVSEDDPCVDARRMLHVWTFDRGEVGGRTVQVTDPFGVPLRASVSVERVDG